MILQHLNDFYKPFGRYIASKVTYSHPNIAYLSSYLCLRKFRQCRNSTFGNIQKDLHKPIRLKLNFYIFYLQNFGGTPNNSLKIPKNAQLTPFSKLRMIPQKLSHCYQPFGHNKIGRLWLSVTVQLK
jgi:hypothetical protein